MKKIIAGLFAAILTTAGLVAVTSTSAQAACTQYICNTTTTKAKAPKSVQSGKPVKLKVAVDTRGNIRTQGTVTIVITGPGGYDKTITKTVSGKDLNINVGKLKKAGKYKVQVSYAGSEGFRDSVDVLKITVKPKKK